jgi:thiosulfate/3-mercaptopyruvate sulfurtransferase
MTLLLSEHLVDTKWLEEYLDGPDIRIIDCHYDLEKGEKGVSLKSGRRAWEHAHIPNSIYIDLLKELSDANTDLPFMMPPSSHFSEVMSEKGIGDGSRVILYDREKGAWASRLWLMLRENGFTDVAVLNGGWKKWTNENRPSTTAFCPFPGTCFTPRRHKPSFFTHKEEVLGSIQNRDVHLICALDHREFCQAHIPSSLNIPLSTLVTPQDNTFLPIDDLHGIFRTTGAKKKDRIMTYCGGGIASSCIAFLLILLGYENVAVYDGSMEEWKRGPNLPVERRV